MQVSTRDLVPPLHQMRVTGNRPVLSLSRKDVSGWDIKHRRHKWALASRVTTATSRPAFKSSPTRKLVVNHPMPLNAARRMVSPLLTCMCVGTVTRRLTTMNMLKIPLIALAGVTVTNRLHLAELVGVIGKPTRVR